VKGCGGVQVDYSARSCRVASLVALLVTTATACATSERERKPETAPSASAKASASSAPSPSRSPSAVSRPASGAIRHASWVWGPAEGVAERRLAEPDFPAAVIRVRGDSACAVWVAQRGRSVQVEAASRYTTGRWASAAVIGPPTGGYVYQLEAALGPDDSAVVAWTDSGSDGENPRVLVATREDDAWQPPHELGQGKIGDVTIDDSGAVTAAWTTPGGVVTLARQVNGQWEEPQPLAQDGDAPELAVNRHGDLALVWTTWNGVGVALRPRESGRWTRPSSLRGLGTPDDAKVAIDDRGRALAMWPRSQEEESFARRHLAWTQTTDDGTWTAPQYLDVHARADLIGDQLGLSMNPQGRAVAAWSSDDAKVRGALFSFAGGWTTPEDVAGIAFEPTALLTPSRSAVVMLNVSTPRDWVYRKPGGAWTQGGRVTSRDPLDSYGHGRQMAVLYLVGNTVTARFLNVPARHN
jgi:hypothetical protein